MPAQAGTQCTSNDGAVRVLWGGLPITAEM